MEITPNIPLTVSLSDDLVTAINEAIAKAQASGADSVTLSLDSTLAQEVLDKREAVYSYLRRAGYNVKLQGRELSSNDWEALKMETVVDALPQLVLTSFANATTFSVNPQSGRLIMSSTLATEGGITTDGN